MSSQPISGGSSQAADHTTLSPGLNRALEGFHFQPELKDSGIKAQLQKPGSFSDPDDNFDDNALKRFLLLVQTANFYVSFANTGSFNNNLSADLDLGNHRVVGVILNRYIIARKAYLSNENLRPVPTEASPLNQFLCRIVDQYIRYIAACGRDRNVWTAARKEYLARVRAVWKDALNKSFMDLLAQPPAIPDQGPNPDWIRVNEPARSSLLAFGPSQEEVRVTEQAEVDAQLLEEVSRWLEQRLRRQESIGRGQQIGRESGYADEDGPINPSAESSASVTGASPKTAGVAELGSGAQGMKADVLMEDPEPSQLIDDTQPIPAPQEQEPHTAAGPTKPVIDRRPGWLERYTTANESYQAQLKGTPVVPERRPQGHFPKLSHIMPTFASGPFVLEKFKLQASISTSIGMGRVFEHLLTRPELRPNWHRDYEHGWNLARAQANMYRRCIGILGGISKDTPRSFRATCCCEWHTVSGLKRQSEGQASTMSDLLDLAESVPGLHREYRDAYGIARILDDFFSDTVDLIGVKRRCR
ncbi:hypothetical protein NKR19_g4927 [Coniochaeta hoffmannii]|uniref:Uncharacterized protein n=1 Tax=Coniochaeta hoffmannii TaxID=91930 RepID=A0AA38RNU2_9PEZI|nr:hypothetical protein NKR19_g4927 [Coniochaeta hoffmannii]